MNRKKLQEKLIRIIGGQGTYKSFLLDNLIAKLFELLNPGQKIKIDELGFFHKINFKVSSNRNIENNHKVETLSNIIVFSESENLDESINEEFIFFEPIKFEFEFNPLDNLFSLSTEKDFLSNELVQSDIIPIPSSQNENYDLFDSKLEKLISSSVISENNQIEIPCLSINLEKELAIEITNNIIAEEYPEKTAEGNDLPNDEIIAADFTELLIDQSSESISKAENEIIDLEQPQNEAEFLPLTQLTELDLPPSEKEDDSIFNELLKLDEIEEQTVDNKSFLEKDNTFQSELAYANTEINSEQETIDEDLEISDEISWDKIISEISSDDEEISIDSFFQNQMEVEKLTEDEINDKDTTNIIAPNEENIVEESIELKDELTEDVLEEVIKEIETEEESVSESLINEYQQDEVIEKAFETEESYEEKIQDENDIVDEVEFANKFEDEIFNEEELETVEEELLHKSESREFSTSKVSEEEIPRKSSKVWILAVILIVAINVSILYYLFPQYFNFLNRAGEQISYNVSDKNTNRIERSFEIPVTYPYPPIEEEQVYNLIESKIQIETNSPEKSSDVKNVQENNTSNKIEKPIQEKVHTQNVNVEKVSETISKSGDNYIAQVASFRSESVAQREVDKIKSKGYSSFIEKIEIPNRGTWFRVKVSGFKSVDEAKNFQVKYNKGEI